MSQLDFNPDPEEKQREQKPPALQWVRLDDVEELAKQDAEMRAARERKSFSIRLVHRHKAESESES